MSPAPLQPGEIAPGIREGDVLLGKYRIERVIGTGGMGVVIAATHIELEQRIAIKMLLPAVLENPEAVARFARESRAAVKVTSEHVARVSDVGRLPNGCPYMVMEYLEGTDLAYLVERQGQLSLTEAVDFVLQASEAIAEAHSLGIVHRDLKPSNLFVIERADGARSIKVLDFGISKVTPGMSASDAPASMTQTSVVLGSPVYMSPEQLASARDADARSDIWALGTILFELLTARPPFLADTLPQLCMAITQGTPPPIASFRKDVPAELEAVILRCLAKQPADRFADVGDLARALVPFATQEGAGSADIISRVLSRGRATSKAGPVSYADRSPSGGTRGSWWQRARPAGPAVWAVWLGAATVLAVLATVIALRAHRTEPEQSAILAAPPVGTTKGDSTGIAAPSAMEATGKAATEPTATPEAADAGGSRTGARPPSIHAKPPGKAAPEAHPRTTSPSRANDDDVFQNRR